jgi:hypothetical protein
MNFLSFFMADPAAETHAFFRALPEHPKPQSLSRRGAPKALLATPEADFFEILRRSEIPVEIGCRVVTEGDTHFDSNLTPLT